MTNNLIEQAVKDNELFQTKYPDELINAAEYVDRMDEAVKFVGLIPEPEKDQNEVAGEEVLFTTTKIKNVLDETISLYSNLKKAYVEYNKKVNGIETQNIRADRGVSELYLLSPGAYDKNSVRVYSGFDTIVLNGDKDMCCSKVTFILALVSSKYNEFDNKDEIKDLVRSLLFTIADTFNPNVVTTLIGYLMDVGVLNFIFGEELESVIKELYETLVMIEGILLSNDDGSYFGKIVYGIKTTDLAAYKLARFVFSSEEQILDDKNHFNWFGTILNPPVYDKYRKDLYTLILLNLVHSTTGRVGSTNRYDHMDNANRIIRKSVTDWIKHKDISERPAVPEVYNFINITSYLKDIYTHALTVIGDMPSYIDGIERNKEAAEKVYNDFKAKWDEKCKSENKPTEEDRKRLYSLKSEKDTALDEYKTRLRHKSLIAFLYQEILSNEKVVAMSMDMDLIAFILAFEPGIDNAMHDTHTSITALYNKRDFKPLGIESVNPYYCHADEGDIISEKTKLFATVMSGLANYNMGSRIACSFINTPVEAANVISNVEYTATRAKLTLSNDIVRHVKTIIDAIDKIDNTKELYDNLKATDYYKTLKSSILDFNFNVVESRNNLVVVINHFFEKWDDSILDIENQYAEVLYTLLRVTRSVKESIVAYDETVWGESNIFSQIKKIFERLGSQTAIITARTDIENNQRQYSLWPRINQYFFPIQDEELNEGKSKERTAHENYYDLMPGDLESGRYKIPYERLDDRYSTSKGCD